VPKFRWATPPNSQVIRAHLLQFKPIFDPPLKKVVRGAAVPGGGALLRLGRSLARLAPPNLEVVRNRAKFCMFFAPQIFLGCAPKILDWHYKIRPSTDHRAKFHAGQPTHLGDLASEEKNIVRKTEVLPKTIVFGRTKKHVNPVLTCYEKVNQLIT